MPLSSFSGLFLCVAEDWWDSIVFQLQIFHGKAYRGCELSVHLEVVFNKMSFTQFRVLRRRVALSSQFLHPNLSFSVVFWKQKHWHTIPRLYVAVHCRTQHHISRLNPSQCKHLTDGANFTDDVTRKGRITRDGSLIFLGRRYIYLCFTTLLAMRWR